MAYVTVAILVCIEEASAADESFYREWRAKGISYPWVSGDRSIFDTLIVHPDEHPVGRRILRILGESAHRIRPPNLMDWRVGKSDRLPYRADDPFRQILKEVCSILSIDREIDIYLSPIRHREMDLLLTDPPALVIGGGVMGAFSPLEIRFWLAKMLSYVRNQTWIAYGYDRTELSLLIYAACRAVEIQIRTPAEQEDEIAEITRVIQRSLSRRSRSLLEETCLEFVSCTEYRFTEWARAMQHTSLHAGLWLVNDLETGLTHLRRTDPEFGRIKELHPLSNAIRKHPLATELIQFWISEKYNALRQSLG
jgi:hypothetical protein